MTVTLIWVVRLDAPNVLTPKRLAWLDDSEHQRASRFYSSALADRWRVAHVALRDILGGVTAADPGELRFTQDVNGKPGLVTARRVAFNLSHSGDLALVAVTEGAAVGVDVERLSEVPEMEGVAASHFAREEQEALWGAPENLRLQIFFRIWTRKEAYVKATGVGIGPALSRFAVTADAKAPRLLYAYDTPRLEAWSLSTIDVPEPYIAALCVADSAPSVSLREWVP